MRTSLFKGASSLAIILVLIIAVVAAIYILPSLSLTGGGGFSFTASPGTQGVVINSLKADQTSVYGGSVVDLELAVQNIGGSAATNVNAQLYGFSSSGWTVSPSNSQQISDGTLFGTSESSGLKGEQGVVDWTLAAPASQATAVAYPGIVYVTYTYSTTANVVMQVATNTFLQTSTIKPGISSQTYTLGPLSAVATLAIPPEITITSSGPNPSSIPIQFDIENTGGGGVYSSNPNDQSVSVTFTGVSCPSVTNPIRLIGGKSRLIDCTVSVSDISTSNPFEQKLIAFTVNYNYFVQSSASITVLSSIQGITPSATGTCANGATNYPTCTITPAVDVFAVSVPQGSFPSQITVGTNPQQFTFGAQVKNLANTAQSSKVRFFVDTTTPTTNEITSCDQTFNLLISGGTQGYSCSYTYPSGQNPATIVLNVSVDPTSSETANSNNWFAATYNCAGSTCTPVGSITSPL